MAYKDPVKQREFQRQWQKQQRAKRRAKVIEMLGAVCANCGYDKDPRAFELDHIEPLLTRGEHDQGSNLYLRVYNGSVPLNLVQLLCANCHTIKSYNEIYGTVQVAAK